MGIIITQSSGLTNFFENNTLPDRFLVEADLTIHPYQGVIGCFQTDWSSWLEPKTIYLPEHWDISKFMFHFEYNDAKLDNLIIYECYSSDVDCEDKAFQKGETIHDAYVVTFLSHYSFYQQTYSDSGKKIYPEFMYSPPSSWILLREVKIADKGFLSQYNPRIYYAP